MMGVSLHCPIVVGDPGTTKLASILCTPFNVQINVAKSEFSVGADSRNQIVLPN